MKIFIQSVLFLCVIVSCTAQDYSIHAKLNNGNIERCYLAGFKDGKTVLLDSILLPDENLTFILNKNFKPGLYRIILKDKNESGFYNNRPVNLDFIFNAENIRLEADYDNIVESMKILNSPENDIFYQFQKIKEPFNEKFFLLTSLLGTYSVNDPFYLVLSDEYIDIQQNYSKALTGLIEKLPGSIASSIIKSDLLPVLHPSIRGDDLNGFYRKHFFDLVSFNDERLINSAVYTSKVFEYLRFFSDPEFSSKEQELEYIIAVDKIMDKVSVNPVIYDFILNFLIDGFDELKMEAVLVHIAENYIEGGCETDNKKLAEKRLEGYKKMAPGNKVSDIISIDENGKQIRLLDLKNQYLLVVFWASWCPHCTNVLSQLKKWYATRSIDLEIFAVSIDSSRFDWEENLMMNDYPWINTCGFAGWNDKAAKDYNIYATPTMFLVDRGRKIIAKPLTFREFKSETDQL